MTTENANQPVVTKQGTVVLRAGQRLNFTDVVDADPGRLGSAISAVGTIGKTLVVYSRAAKQLLREKYISQAELAPPHMREECDIFVLRCTDGVLVRYDSIMDGKARVRVAEPGVRLAEIAPLFSEQLVHFPDDPATYDPGTKGPAIVMRQVDGQGAYSEVGKVHPIIYATTRLPDGFQMPQPPQRPPCLVTIQNELDLFVEGVIVPSDMPLRAVMPQNDQRFIAHSRMRLPVGWQTIEIYPSLDDTYWNPEYAPLWAEIDLQASIAQRNLTTANLRMVDGRAEARKQYAALLDELEAILSGPEEPVHQFLKRHPELICPTSEFQWSKFVFGDTISDFVFREAHNDYLLVEIEAPTRQLFRKDGEPRYQLTHAVQQTNDWIEHIANNRERIENAGLTGISTNPRVLIVIGRSATLTEGNRQKLITLQAQHNKLRILTYDDLLQNARANLERILGPLSLRGQNMELYFY